MHSWERQSLGREVELAVLVQDVVGPARARDGRLAMIEGAPGLGKTALLAATRARAEAAGLRVLSARASEMEQEFPLGVVRQLLGRPPPGLGARTGHRPGRPSADQEAARLERLYSAVVDLAAGAPLVVCLDDAQWADVPSLRFVEYLTRRLDGLPIALVVTARAGDRDGSTSRLHELRFDPRAIRLRLRPLDEHSVAAIVRAQLPDADDGFCAECHRSSAGNPLYLRELLAALTSARIGATAENARAVADAAPRTVATHVLARLQRVHPDAPRLAYAMASLGAGARLEHTASVGRVGDSRAAELAWAFVQENILASDDPVAFVHPVVERALRAVLTPQQADTMRRAGGRLLIEAQAPVEQVAGQLVDTLPGGRGWVAQALRDGARQALALGAPERAVRFLRRALGEPPEDGQRSAILGELAFAEDQVGCSSAVDHYREALASASDDAERGRLTLALGLSLISRSRLAEASELLESTLARCGAVPSARAQQVEAALISASMMDPEALTRIRPRLEQLAQLPLDSPVGRAARAALALAGTFLNASRARILALAREALADTELAPVTWGTDIMAIHAAILAEDFESSRALLTKALARGRAEGNVRQWGWALEHLADLALRLGSLREADDLSRQLAELLSRWDDPLARASGYAARIEILVERGDLRSAEEVLTQAAAICEGPMQEWSGFGGFRLLLAARGRMRLAQHHAAEAASDLVNCVRKAREAGLEPPVGYDYATDAAVALRLAGAEVDAAALARRELERARAFGGARALGVALRATALADPGQDRLELLRESVGVLENSPARLDHARSLLELGAELRRTNRRAEAQEALTFCLDFASRLGATALERRAHSELNATGARPRRAARSGREALTACELRVAQLAADGCTNVEISRILNVTLKTVECHLGRAYAKLDISGPRARTRLQGLLISASSEIPLRLA